MSNLKDLIFTQLALLITNIWIYETLRYQEDIAKNIGI
jgi:hypothetical protein